MMPVVLFRVGSVDPVEDVQCSIGTQEKDVVSGQIFHITVSLQDHQLRKNGYRLAVNRESPQQFHQTEFADSRPDQVREKGQDRTGDDRKLPMQKGILTFVVCALDGLLEFDRVNDGGRGSNVDDFHDGIVEGIKRCEEIQVSGHKDSQVEFVRFDGYSCCEGLVGVR
jgi:hypothetical protein